MEELRAEIDPLEQLVHIQEEMPARKLRPAFTAAWKDEKSASRARRFGLVAAAGGVQFARCGQRLPHLRQFFPRLTSDILSDYTQMPIFRSRVCISVDDCAKRENL